MGKQAISIAHGAPANARKANRRAAANGKAGRLARSCKAIAKACAVVALAVPAMAAAQQYDFGRHYPNGQAAVDHMYGPEGTFRPMNAVAYPFAFYELAQYNNPCSQNGRVIDANNDGHADLIGYAQGSNQATAPDKDCNVLLDFNGDLLPDSNGGGGSAFQQHFGIGAGGASGAGFPPPFNQFWFDDNWLARYMSIAYDMPQPTGLFDPADRGRYNRWAILGGDYRNWSKNLNPWGTGFPDHLSFRGLYAVARNDAHAAYSAWNSWLSLSGATYNAADQRFDYPNIHENYHLGLARIHVERMIQRGWFSGWRQNLMIQQSVSLRSHIVSNQEQDAGSGDLLGWLTTIGNNPQGTSVMGTETDTLQILALGVGGSHAFEAGKSPMNYGSGNYFVRPHNVISAVAGLSSPGHPVYGPYRNFPTGSMTVDFFLRSPSPSGTVANLDIFDSATGTVLASRSVTAGQMLNMNQWTRISLTAYVANPGNSLEFRVYWPGGNNLDIAYVQVR